MTRPPGELVAAEGALDRALAFLRTQTRKDWLVRPGIVAHPEVRARLIGNWLDELDRLFEVLLDASARGARTRTRARRPHRGTAGKLAGLGAGAGVHRARLDGLGNARAAYRFTRGVAVRADVRGGAYMTAGWNGEGTDALARFAVGDRIVMSGRNLDEVCDFYGAIGSLALRDEGGAPG